MLQHPLTVKAVLAEFQASLKLQRDAISVRKSIEGTEAVVDGAWAFSKLTKAFRDLGYAKIGGKDSVCFVNKDSTVGFVCYGVEADPASNKWIRFNFEIQARSLARAKRDPSRRVLIGP